MFPSTSQASPLVGFPSPFGRSGGHRASSAKASEMDWFYRTTWLSSELRKECRYLKVCRTPVGAVTCSRNPCTPRPGSSNLSLTRAALWAQRSLGCPSSGHGSEAGLLYRHVGRGGDRVQGFQLGPNSRQALWSPTCCCRDLNPACPLPNQAISSFRSHVEKLGLAWPDHAAQMHLL